MPTRLGPHAPQALRLQGWLIAAAYVPVFLGLDWVSFIRPYQGLNITPWNPQPALAIALLLWRPRWLPLVWLSLAAAELVVRGWPADPFVALAATATLTLSYAAIARVLTMRLDPVLALATQRDLAWFTTTAIGGSLLSGTLYVSTYASGGIGPEGPLTVAIVRYWIGDAVGLVVILPALLMLADPVRRGELQGTLRTGAWWGLAALALLLLVLVFRPGAPDQFKLFYLLFLPVVWAAARLGLAGAVLCSALTQVGLIVAVQAGSSPDLTVFELQVLMVALTMTGLVLGVAVDARERAEAGLRGSLRLAAAGQMAAALAHELSQPLTALNSYAQATRLLVASSALPAQDRLARLGEVAGRMADDALRASEVVKRLRDFFRSGSTQLRPLLLQDLVDEALQSVRQRALAQGVALACDPAPGVEVLADPVQLGIVLRNLLGNAMDAAVAAPGPASVTVRAVRDAGSVRIEVRDSGPGVDATRLPVLFDSGPSEKPWGMGIGLGISRAIAEAHGGRLWAEPGPPGLFHLLLPVHDAAVAEERHAR